MKTSALLIAGILYSMHVGASVAQQNPPDNTEKSNQDKVIEEIGKDLYKSLPDGVRAVIEGGTSWVTQFYHDDHSSYAYQCGNPGTHYTKAGNWSDPIHINTDTGWGGCQLAFGIVDSKGDYKNDIIKVTFEGNPKGGQECQGTIGTQQIPITTDRLSPTQRMRIDTDNRTDKGCDLTFTVDSPGVELNIQYWAMGDAGQCGNAKPQGQWHTAKQGSPVKLGLYTNGPYGGCKLSTQLKRK
jgi:hypothetical protein